MSFSSPSMRYTSVRPELDCIVEYMPGESLEAFSARTGIPIHQLVKLNSNESPYPPIPEVLKALSDYTNYNMYPDTNSVALRSTLSSYTEVDPQFIVVGHGSSELIYLLWHIFLSAGDTIICCPPTFSFYTTCATLCNASVLEVPRATTYELEIEGILAALRPSTKLIVLCSPNNPTGNPVHEKDVLTLLETGRIVVVDEAYVEFSNQPHGIARLVPMYKNLVVLRTFSKWAGLAGLRVGYGLCPDWIAQNIRRAQNPFEVNMAGHIAAILTLNNLDYVQNNVRRIVSEREHLFKLLAQQPYLTPIPSEGNFILAHLRDDTVKIEKVRATVESHGILLRYFQSPSLQNSLRVTVGLPQHTERLAKALASLDVPF
jgi:histidinol-phosphate aminotransferase